MPNPMFAKRWAVKIERAAVGTREAGTQWISKNRVVGDAYPQTTDIDSRRLFKTETAAYNIAVCVPHADGAIEVVPVVPPKVTYDLIMMRRGVSTMLFSDLPTLTSARRMFRECVLREAYAEDVAVLGQIRPITKFIEVCAKLAKNAVPTGSFPDVRIVPKASAGT